MSRRPSVVEERARSAPPNLPETWAPLYGPEDDGNAGEHLWVSHIADRVKLSYLEPMLPRSGVIAEFGCGSGRLLRYAVKRGMHGIGIDFTAEALDSARRAAARDGLALELIQSDVRDVPLPSNSVDVVVSTGLFEHFDDLGPLVAEMVRVLKPGGLFYSDVVPARISLYRALLWLRRTPVDVYERNVTREEIEDVMRGNGLTEIDVFGAGVFPPIIPFVERSHTVRTIIGGVVRATLPFWTMWDRTRVAERFGQYFFATARKPS